MSGHFGGIIIIFFLTSTYNTLSFLIIRIKAMHVLISDLHV